jgi:hypothetical protein
MAEKLKLARLYFVVLAIVAAGRWAASLMDVPYPKMTDKLSIVIATLFSAIFYGAFCRRWRGHKLGDAVLLGMTLGLTAQVVVFLSMLASYVFGITTYFNYPAAILGSSEAARLAPGEQVPFLTALVARTFGLVVNTLLSGIAGALGWAMGALLPESR